MPGRLHYDSEKFLLCDARRHASRLKVGLRLSRFLSVWPWFPPRMKPERLVFSESRREEVPEPAHPGRDGYWRLTGGHQEAHASLHCKHTQRQRVGELHKGLRLTWFLIVLQFGPNGYYFAIDPNGYVLLHPNLQPLVGQSQAVASFSSHVLKGVGERNCGFIYVEQTLHFSAFLFCGFCFLHGLSKNPHRPCSICV